MNKAPDAFRTISEVAEILGTPAHVLRFWESKFTQLRPVKHTGGRRYYKPADLALLAGIRKLLREDGMTIRGVQKLLRERGVKYVSSLAPLPEPVAEANDLPAIAAGAEDSAIVFATAPGRSASSRPARSVAAAAPPPRERVAEAPHRDNPGPTMAERLRAAPAPAQANQARQLRDLRGHLAALHARRSESDG